MFQRSQRIIHTYIIRILDQDYQFLARILDFRNFEFFDAPYIAFLGMNPAFGTTVALDVGMYAQSLMLTMVAFGLHSCPMGTMRNYPDMVRDAFDIQDETKILFGLSFGYEDTAVAANNTRTEREPVSASVMFRS